MELLDLLTKEDSSFPHAAARARSSSSALSSPSSSTFPSGPVVGGKQRPLATLAALRRPPIDPIILAASLSSGPHVTRHHFHHTYGDKGHSKHSRQMPASQRKEIQAGRLAGSGQQDQHTRTHTRNARSQSLTGSYANCDLDDGEDDEGYAAVAEPSLAEKYPERTLYPSKQAPRSVRLKIEQEAAAAKAAALAAAAQRESAGEEKPGESSMAAAHAAEVAQSAGVRASDEQPSDEAPNASAPVTSTARQEASSGTQALLQQALSERQAIASAPTTPSLNEAANPFTPAPPAPAPALARLSSIVRPPPLIVRCYARTRIPTPHGEVFCHLYKNNHDNKEHMALVVDPAQNEPDVSVEELLARRDGPRPLRSRTLDEVWGSEETDMERIVRGAYVGRLGPGCQVASHGTLPPTTGADEYEPPLVRIHSECYTGETIGSQRCDCGEQLDEALRLILSSGAGSSSPSSPSSSSAASPRRPRLPRGVVVYMRQEGRGIGLLDKLMAYNLQDMGHDTVSANVLLGHLPDARRYNIASAILQDLGIHQCRLLTNNPEKMEALESEGIPVKERVPMVPRAWLQDVQRKRRSRKSGHRSKRKGPKEGKRERQTSAKSTASLSSKSAKHNRVAALASPHSDLSRSILSQAASLDGHDDDEDDADDPHSLGCRHQGSDVEDEDDSDYDSESEDGDEYEQHLLRSGGATMIGSSATRSVELERYLRTKIEKMGHLLDLPPGQGSGTNSPAPHTKGGNKESKGDSATQASAGRQREATGESEPAVTGGGAEEDDGHHTGTESLLDEEELRRLAIDDDEVGAHAAA